MSNDNKQIYVKKCIDCGNEFKTPYETDYLCRSCYFKSCAICGKEPQNKPRFYNICPSCYEKIKALLEINKDK